MHCDEPLLIDGAKFGWVSRKRLWFGSDENGQSAVRNSAILPEGVSLAKAKRLQCMEAHWAGKPVPPRVAFKGGSAQPLIRLQLCALTETAHCTHSHGNFAIQDTRVIRPHQQQSKLSG